MTTVRNVSAGKVVNGQNGRPSLKTSAPASGTPNMPRVGGHTTNITPSQGVSGGANKGC